MSERILIVPTEETADILPGYLERRRAEFLQVQGHLAREDFTALLSFGHNVKGTAGSYGLPELGALADVVHQCAGQRDAAACAKAIEAYGQYLARVEIDETIEFT